MGRVGEVQAQTRAQEAPPDRSLFSAPRVALASGPPAPRSRSGASSPPPSRRSPLPPLLRPPPSSLLFLPHIPSRRARSAYLVASLGPQGFQVSNRGVSAFLSVPRLLSASLSLSLFLRLCLRPFLARPAVWWPAVAAGPARGAMSGACTSYVSAEQEVVRGFSCPRPGGEAAAVFCCGFRDHKYCCDDPHSFFPYEHSYMWWLRYRPRP